MNRKALQQNHVSKFRQGLMSALTLAFCMIVACFLAVASSVAQTKALRPTAAITLDPPSGWDLQIQTFDAQGNRLPEAPANFRRLGEVKAGEVGTVHTLTLRFAETVTLIHIKSTADFPILQGGTCAERGTYAANTTCTMLVRFAPQGPGNRLGHLVISHTGSASQVITSKSNSGVTTSASTQVTTDAFGLGGYGYSPVISFIPSTITTVPGTYPSSKGLLSGAHNLTVDGGDTLWVADTGNNAIRALDSSGNFTTLASGYSAPWGVAVDTFGEAYFDQPAANLMYEIYDYGPVVQITGTTTGSCPASAPCTLSSHALSRPGEMSIDPYNHLFLVDSDAGAAFSTVQPLPANLIFLYDPFPYQTSPASAMAVDSGDNLYSLWANGGDCEIVQSSLYNAENNNVSFTKIAGGHTCGFSGDGGLAGNAEIGSSIGQIVFDAAGDLYFSDTNNQRVRRIDYETGVIRTIAGKGTAGYTGDGGGATAAQLSAPTGVGVDSQGNVYIISSAATGQVIRKAGSPGLLAFASQSKGVASAAQLVAVTNTGNSAMTLTNAVIAGANAGDFKIDNTSTTCMLTSGATLAAAQTCRIGVIFTPAGVGARSATLTLLDNTVNGADSVTLNGTGALPAPVFKITSPASGASYTSGTAVPFSVSVTSTSGPQPTGTVQFKVDGANYGSPVTVSSTGTASTSVTGLTTTTHTLSATYSGDTNYAAAGPVSVSITVKAAATVKFTSPLTTQTMAATSTIGVHVTVTSKTAPAPTGKVTFSVDGKAVTTASIVSGTASANLGTLAAGSHTLRAAYSGDKYHFASSTSETITVSP